jgi:hypothetical protein
VFSCDDTVTMPGSRKAPFVSTATRSAPNRPETVQPVAAFFSRPVDYASRSRASQARLQCADNSLSAGHTRSHFVHW